MNQSSHGFSSFFYFFIFLLLSQSATARFLPTKQGFEETHNKLSHGMIQADSWPDFPQIIREEEEEDEEWEKRRMMLEAHLDYVYTQNEKP
ncbi:putative phytosulfokines 6 [Cucurbita maxima]|uniref:Phytosulfokine n=1 Tax=Cucurbita maxima TaxID=3661 RepID=A0A6J1KTY7_CUCMA|nr:putative phytosulfokines 6 [Cucurbita maxima]